jgi:Raf kinase inhibitor-like YbhB/YbcL family protein
MLLPPRRRAPLALALLVVLLAAACGTTGRTLRPPPPGATAPTTAPTTTADSAAFNTVTTATTTLFVLSSPAFQPGDTLPKRYTCDGAGTSPPLTWANVPPGTVELVLVVTDPDANSFVHWMVAGIPPNTTGIQPNELPSAAVVLANSAHTHVYSPPCPPKGQDHTYEFTLYPLKAPSGLTAASDTATAVTALDKANLRPAVLTADYARA